VNLGGPARTPSAADAQRHGGERAAHHHRRERTGESDRYTARSDQPGTSTGPGDAP
jgi:hypothetical protein